MRRSPKVAAKKLRTLRSADPAVARRRLYAFLARRGYDGSAIRRVMDSLPASSEADRSNSGTRPCPVPPGAVYCVPYARIRDSPAVSSRTSSATRTRSAPARRSCPRTIRRCSSPTPGWCSSSASSSARSARPFGAARDHRAEVRAGRRQAQRSRAGGAHRAAPHVLRDARQFLVRRLLQARRDPLRVGVRHGGAGDSEGASARHRLRVGRRGARAVEGDLRDLPTVASTGSASTTTSGRWRTRARAVRAREIYVDLAHIARRLGLPGRRDRRVDGHDAHGVLARCVRRGRGGGALSRDLESRVHAVRPSAGRRRCVPLPKPSVDTGAGLERIAAVMQGVTNNYHTDLFVPLIAKAEAGARHVVRRSSARADVGTAVWPVAAPPKGTDRRHTTRCRSACSRITRARSRSCIADGVFPSNEGRGYVLRRILRRGVRHAWLLGRREPTLDKLVSVGRRRDAGCVSGARAAPRAHRRHDARGGRALSRDDRRGDAALRPARARELDAGIDGDSRHDQRRAMRSGCTTRSAFRSTSRSSWRTSAATPWTSSGFEEALAGAALSVARGAKGTRARRRGRRARGLRDVGDAGRARRSDRSFVGYGATEIDTEVVAVRRLRRQSRRARARGDAVLRGVRRTDLRRRGDRGRGMERRGERSEEGRRQARRHRRAHR